jgi:hypothetical protein
MLPLAFLLWTARADLSFESARYGIAFNLPADWSIAVREKDAYVVLAKVPQSNPDAPGAFVCELALAPESLNEYRTRLDTNAARGRLPGKLIRNELVKSPHGERLISVQELQPPGRGLWYEVAVRLLANRQMYTFTLNVDEPTHARLRDLFGQVIDSARFTAPDLGLDPDPLDKERPKPLNRWTHRDYKFAVDLPEGWKPVLAPAEIALLFATGSPDGIWSDNLLVLAKPHANQDLEALAQRLPEDLRREDPQCEILSCQVVPRGPLRVLETIVRTQRGPFSMTVLEHRFRGDRFDYEFKATVETLRFEALLPALRRALESFQEVPGEVIRPLPNPLDE